MFDYSKPENKKYIPIAMFIFGTFVGGIVMRLWCAKQGKVKEFAQGGTIVNASPPMQAVAPTPVQVVAPAPIPTPVVADVSPTNIPA